MTDTLGDRMKSYEEIERKFLTPRTPIILRLDGRAFHTYTAKLVKPFDDDFRRVMNAVTSKLMEEVQGSVVGYCQSDEISILLHTWNRFDTQIWFGGNVQKMVSVAASEATAYMNAVFTNGTLLATFDARVFTIPKEDVENYFLWRHKDAMRNAISSYATNLLGHAACMGLKTGEKLNLIPPEQWNAVHPHHKFGTFFGIPFEGHKWSSSTGIFSDVSPKINELLNHQDEV